jgi:hypothetical protein
MALNLTDIQAHIAQHNTALSNYIAIQNEIFANTLKHFNGIIGTLAEHISNLDTKIITLESKIIDMQKIDTINNKIDDYMESNDTKINNIATTLEHFELSIKSFLHMQCNSFDDLIDLWLSTELKNNAKINNYNLAIKLVEKQGILIKHVPNQTVRLATIALNTNIYAIEYIKCQTKEMCISIIRRNPNMLKFVNSEFHSEELFLLVLNNKLFDMNNIIYYSGKITLSVIKLLVTKYKKVNISIIMNDEILNKKYKYAFNITVSNNLSQPENIKIGTFYKDNYKNLILEIDQLYKLQIKQEIKVCESNNILHAYEIIFNNDNIEYKIFIKTSDKTIEQLIKL